MAFNSMAFLFGLLPAVLVCYFLLPARWRTGRNWVLLVFSLAFYAWGGVRMVPFLVLSILLYWGGGLLVAPGRSHRKGWLMASLVVNVGILAYFKYTGFLLENLNALGLGVTVPEILMPAGISFYTFQGISYLVDVYRGTVAAERNLPRLALYFAFFPQMIQGPILRYGDMAADLRQRQESLEDITAGLTRFCFGLAKKLLLADALGQAADAAFASGDRLTVGLAWIGAVGYTLQLYFDFSGYTDMAIGLGRVFGFRLPENFNYPYITRSAGEFWRRWHMTLSFWFRDYVYIPLGGNRCARGRQIVNILVVWMLTGLWHGSAWTFVAWGLYYAALLLGERFLWGKALETLPGAVRHLYALVLVIVGWVFFRSATLTQAGQMIASMFGFAPGGAWSGETTYYLLQFRWEWILAIPAALPIKPWLEGKLTKADTALSRSVLLWGPKLLAGVLLALSILRLLSATFTSFLYFQF